MYTRCILFAVDLALSLRNISQRITLIWFLSVGAGMVVDSKWKALGKAVELSILYSYILIYIYSYSLIYWLILITYSNNFSNMYSARNYQRHPTAWEISRQPWDKWKKPETLGWTFRFISIHFDSNGAFQNIHHGHDLRNVFCSPQCGLVPSQQASSMPRAKRSSNPMNTTQIYTATSSYKQLQSATPCKFQMSQEVLLNTTWKFVTSFQSSLCVRGESWRFMELDLINIAPMSLLNNFVTSRKHS